MYSLCEIQRVKPDLPTRPRRQQSYQLINGVRAHAQTRDKQLGGRSLGRAVADGTNSMSVRSNCVCVPSSSHVQVH